MEPLDIWNASALYTMVSPCITIFTFEAVTVTPSSNTSFSFFRLRFIFIVGMDTILSRFPILTVIFSEYSSYPSFDTFMTAVFILLGMITKIFARRLLFMLGLPQLLLSETK